MYLALQYGGGLGKTEPGSYVYYLNNTYSLGAMFPFQWDDAWLSTSISCTYNALQMPSRDMLCSLYLWKGLWNYKAGFSGDFQVRALNKNHGDVNTADLDAKIFSFFRELQLRYNLNFIRLRQ